MNNLISQMQIQVNEKVFLKDPNSSELGKKIIAKSIELIVEMGFESFTFRKLATKLETTESSIYRYFESKHKLLLYLTSWYWGWLEYHLVFSTANILSAEERLKAAIKVISKDIPDNEMFGHINLGLLNKIVISESSKAYLTKQVDDANKEGFYAGYKRMVLRISEIIKELNPNFGFASTLTSTIIEGIQDQKYFAEHLPTLTDISGDSSILTQFYTDMAISTIQQNNTP
ncbi:TetR family transcriptional regulator [Roseivirga seohaensis subsp. aquiponti]|uniref:TetR family transcriptional regulator n=1 Tax=Roseivirga seohaensis subsp. aquiponti TaxID=1566026 RepID=A0A0L8AL20_9BACT|nr:TetR/AcrR family transcriptional regulator [Roseivirga seohaensis]KOF03148.1 TetR family transcriptional regulator [Roseivirga seohaensis subsp. aquiponti]